MIKITYYGILAILLISCNSQTTEIQKTQISPQLFSSTYHPPYFEETDRLEKVKDLMPAIHQIISEHAISKKIPGIAYGIVVDDSLVIASATGLMNVDSELAASTNSSFRIASMTKSFTAMAILKLRDDGKLALEDPVSKYIPEMSKLTYLTSDSPAIDIENLLTMTAGFPEDNPWGDRQLDETDQMLIDLIDQGVSFSNAPSYAFEYSNTGYALLGNIISRVSGMPYQDYIIKDILEPLDMNHTYWEYTNIPEEQLVQGYRWEDEQWKKEPLLHDGSYGAMGGLITSIEDFAKYVSYHLSAWPPRNGEETGPIKRSTLREMHSPNNSFLVSDGKNYKEEPCAFHVGYGYGLGISKDCDRVTRVQHGGALPGFGSNYTFYPDYGIGIMAFGNLTYTGPLPKAQIEKLLFETASIPSRQLPVSDILILRQKQVIELIQDWDPELETEIIAENFYPDESRKLRQLAIKAILDKAGAFTKINEMTPWNQLRGNFEIEAQNGIINVIFTLSPEKNPKVQHLDVSFEPHESD